MGNIVLKFVRRSGYLNIFWIWMMMDCFSCLEVYIIWDFRNMINFNINMKIENYKGEKKVLLIVDIDFWG